VWARCLEDLGPLSVGRVWIGKAKGTLSHGVSVNRAEFERERGGDEFADRLIRRTNVCHQLLGPGE
jgi:hypothetical protein